MRSIGRTLALALLVFPAFARAEDKGTTTTTGQSTTTQGEHRSGAGAAAMEGNKDTSADNQKMTDARFVALMHHVNQEEIRAGHVAQLKGHSEDVKNFGKQLITDHTKNDKDLMAAVKQAGMKPSTSSLTAMDKEEMQVDQRKMDQAKKLSGAEFDKAFAQLMKNDHEHMISVLKDHKGDLKAQALQQYADQTLPVLEQHRDMADKALSSSQQASAGSNKNQGRSPNALERRTTDTSRANKGSNQEGNRGDASAKSGAPNPEKQPQ